MKKLLIATTAALTLLVGTAYAADDAPLIGDEGRIKFTLPACKTVESLDKLRDIARSGDQAAYEKLIFRVVTSGECISLERGQAVNVEHFSFWHSALCVRPQGEPDCWWIIQPGVSK
jgi:hypothetical protein